MVTNTYSLTYSGNGNTAGSAPVNSLNYEQGQTVTVLGNTGNLVKSGYSFVGWNTLANGSGITYTQGQTCRIGTSNITLYAKWTANAIYTVTYNSNGGIGGSLPIDSNNYEQGQTVTVLGNTGGLTNAGYTFTGWNTLANGSGTTYTASQIFVMGEANVTLYAMWATITTNPAYTVTYNGNSNTGGSLPIDSNNYEQGQTVTVLGNTGGLTNAGYTFTGWNTLANGSGTTYTASQNFVMGQANVTLYAMWTTITTNPAYIVTYNGNSNTGGSVPIDSNNYEQGQTVTVLGNTGSLVCSGYSFSGWNTQADGTGTTYSQGQTFPMGAANIILYAKWDSAASYVYLQSDSGDYIGSGLTYTYTTANAQITASATGDLLIINIDVNQVQTWQGDFQVPNSLSQLQSGLYSNLTRYPFNNPVLGGLSWYGEGRGCNTLTGWFEVDSVTYSSGNLTAIDLHFEQHCEGVSPALYGQIHWLQ
jgi:uncharacterized repeat protein (TIGR02543 family)